MRYRMKAERGKLLFSRIRIDAKLTSNFYRVKELLSQYPNLRLEREGTSLLYMLCDSETQDHFYSFELDREHVSITIYSEGTPALFMQEAVLRLLGLMETLSESYKASLESLYPYLIMTIASQNITLLAQKHVEEGSIERDVILSKRLISLMKENSSLHEAYLTIMKQFKRTVLAAIMLSGRSGLNIDNIVAETGIEKREIVKAIDDAEVFGYKAVRNGKGRFTLVKV